MQITFIQYGAKDRVDGNTGNYLIERAENHGIAGFKGSFGGCSRAIGQVFVDPQLHEKGAALSPMGQVLLADYAGVDNHSRSACQMQSITARDGMLLHLPAGRSC